MNWKRLATCLLTFVLLLASCFLARAEKDPVIWRNQSDHTRWTNAMIFGNESYVYAKPESIRKAVNLIDDALLLCIDQYNGVYKEKLFNLREAGIKGLPADISAINFSAGTNHRIFTHRGWYHTYSESEKNKAHVDIRKSILMTVVNHIFHFDDYYKGDTANNKCEAMCCLLYVTHIIGDRYHSATYYGAASTLLLAEETESVIHDLEKCLPTLITVGDSSSLIRKLKNMSKEIISKSRKDGSKEHLLELDREYAPKIKNLLKESLYELLKEQSWFSAVFDPKWTSV